MATSHLPVMAVKYMRIQGLVHAFYACGQIHSHTDSNRAPVDNDILRRKALLLSQIIIGCFRIDVKAFFGDFSGALSVPAIIDDKNVVTIDNKILSGEMPATQVARISM